MIKLQSLIESELFKANHMTPKHNPIKFYPKTFPQLRYPVIITDNVILRNLYPFTISSLMS